MTHHSYREIDNITDELKPDGLYVVSHPGWKTYIFIGILLLTIFYWMIPTWLSYELLSLQDSTLHAFFTRRIHWLQCGGVVLGLIFSLLAIRNYLHSQPFRKSCKNMICRFRRLFSKRTD